MKIIEQNNDASSTGSAKNKLVQSKTRTIKNIESLLSNNPTEAIRLMSTLSLEDLENNGFADMLQKERSKFTGTTNTSAHEELATSTGPNTFLIQVLAQHQNEQPNGDTPKYTSQEQTDATLVLGKLLQMGALTLDAVQTLHLSESVVTSLQNSGHIDDTEKARPLYVKNIQSETLGSELEQAIGTALINDTLKSGFSTFAGQESHIQNISNSDLVVDKSTGKLIDAKTFAHKLKTLREENPDTFVLELQNALPGASQIIETGKTVFISLGMYDYKKKGIPFKNKNIVYFYCVSKYPTKLEELSMPNFENNKIFKGFSDHTIGIGACIYAVAKGATYLEKHFSNNKSLGIDTQMAHVCSMDQNDLTKLREYCDTISLIKSNK